MKLIFVKCVGFIGGEATCSSEYQGSKAGKFNFSDLLIIGMLLDLLTFSLTG